MSELKTQKTDVAADSFIATIPDPAVRADCETLAQMCREATGDEGRLWGTLLLGYGEYPYRYASGRTGMWFLAGFSPRKSNLSITLPSGFAFPKLKRC